MTTHHAPFSADWPDEEMDLDRTTLRRTYGSFPSGVVAICAARPEGPVGLVASSFTSVSMDPPLVSFCIQNDSTTWPTLKDRPRLGVSVLASAHSAACRQLSSKTGDRFAGLALTATADGAIFLEGSHAQLDCALDQVMPAGDHGIVLLRVVRARVAPAGDPLVFHASGFRELAVRGVSD